MEEAGAKERFFTVLSFSARQKEYRGLVGDLYDELGIAEELLEDESVALNGLTRAIVGIECGLMGAETGQVDRAVSHFRSVLNGASELEEGWGEEGTKALCRALSGMGIVLRRTGNLEEALKAFSLSCKKCGEIGDRVSEAGELSNIANVYHDMGQLERAVTCYRSSFLIAVDLKDSFAATITLTNMGATYAKMGELDEALKALNRQEK